MRRNILSYGYLGLAAIVVALLDISTWPYDVVHPDQVFPVLYLVCAATLFNFANVRIDRGRLTLTAIVVGASAILLNPLDATLVGLTACVAERRRGSWSIVANGALYASVACIGSLVALELRGVTEMSLWSRIVVVVAVTLGNWALVAVAYSLRTGEAIASIVRHNFTASFYAAFAYYGLAALLLSYVLDGSPTGYLLSTIVCVLALALTDTIAGRRVRRVLESELSDADRHLFHSRAVEGVVHNLRNHMANAVGYLKEVDPRRLDPVDRESIATATAAANDAVEVLRSLSQGATPRVTYSVEPVDLNELITRGLGMARPRARNKEVQLALRESADDVKVRADPLLLREVVTNLVNNAIDAAPPKGHVELKAGRRGNGWPYFSVVDDGPGVSEDHRHHLVEPHFTTKEGGTGLGLFMSYGIVREHQGQLVYSGSSRGAVFTVTLPPFAG